MICHKTFTLFSQPGPVFQLSFSSPEMDIFLKFFQFFVNILALRFQMLFSKLFEYMNLLLA